MLSVSAAEKGLDGLFKDAGRYVAALCAVHLHVSGGLTLPKLKALCAAFGLLSPGRARAILLYLRFLGYVEPVARAAGGEPARYVLTSTFEAAWRGHLRAALSAAVLLEPAMKDVLDRLDEPDIFATFCRRHCECLMAEARLADLDGAFVRLFMHRHAGVQIAWLLLSAEGPDFPSRRPQSISVAAVAKRFQVSRMHVSRMLLDAKHEGVLEATTDGAIAFTPEAREQIRMLYVAQLVQLLVAAAKTLEAWPKPTPVKRISRSARASGEPALSLVETALD
jgi:hypothetical protein